MIPGRIPEITIKFNEKPELPTEGKKVTVEIKGDNNTIVKAEVNRKTLKKQVAKMDEYEDWLGALSGKIKSISDDGVIEVEGAGIQVFERKKKEPAQTEGATAA